MADGIHLKSIARALHFIYGDAGKGRGKGVEGRRHCYIQMKSCSALLELEEKMCDSTITMFGYNIPVCYYHLHVLARSSLDLSIDVNCMYV